MVQVRLPGVGHLAHRRGSVCAVGAGQDVPKRTHSTRLVPCMLCVDVLCSTRLAPALSLPTASADEAPAWGRAAMHAATCCSNPGPPVANKQTRLVPSRLHSPPPNPLPPCTQRGRQRWGAAQAPPTSRDGRCRPTTRAQEPLTYGTGAPLVPPPRTGQHFPGYPSRFLPHQHSSAVLVHNPSRSSPPCFGLCCQSWGAPGPARCCCTDRQGRRQAA